MPKASKCPIALMLFWFASVAQGQSYEKLYSNYRDSLYQIHLIERASNSKAGLGSGFQISASGLVVTNYHVVSRAISEPEKYLLKAFSVDKKEGQLELLHVDVINDLALLRQKGEPHTEFLQLSTLAPQKGETIFALGNPMDLGMTLVPGTYSGIASGSFYDRIHFSGSINPGMSGGPVINSAGQVVGINVATAGNQISFLVPVRKLATLLEEFTTTNQPLETKPTTLKSTIHRHLINNQQNIIDTILAAEWQLRPLGEAMVIGEILPSIQCWGSSEKDATKPLQQIIKGCTGQDVVYLAENFSTGHVEYEFFWLQADNLQSARFYHLYQQQMDSFYAGNSAGEAHVTNFRCQQKFTTQQRRQKILPSNKTSHQPSVIARSAYCVRRYRDFPDLYDIFYVSLSVDQSNRALVSHFTLSGFTQDSATTFSKKFVSEIQWH
ncbi:MAG: serine protease [Gammaproteobacteria bacterium]|nr:serine protease [Gammaproteobacteria bacterium]